MQGMWAIGVGMGGIGGWKWRESGWESSYRSGIDELELWRGKELSGNVCIYENVVLTLWFEKQLKKLI